MIESLSLPNFEIELFALVNRLRKVTTSISYSFEWTHQEVHCYEFTSCQRSKKKKYCLGFYLYIKTLEHVKTHCVFCFPLFLKVVNMFELLG